MPLPRLSSYHSCRTDQANTALCVLNSSALPLRTWLRPQPQPKFTSRASPGRPPARPRRPRGWATLRGRSSSGRPSARP
ncbi:hypothetical protein CRG98_004656 [Punica granatum]|uniref:Uncharacterized protein n=1 Tax=Punica granatum TaxID=22663 RepID=A0A2I0L2E3_PUNGR|nr:hypothetical protein CRG98_004656 [Punica granatum]